MENVWLIDSCVVKNDIRLLWDNMLIKERIFVLKTFYATCSYRLVNEAFHTEFPNSTTTLLDSSILQLVRKFEKGGSIQDKLGKGIPHMVTTVERVESKLQGHFQYLL